MNHTEIVNAKKFLNDLLGRRKKSTYKGYRRGLELFEEYYHKNCDQILAEAKQKLASDDLTEQTYFDRKIEAFYKWMLESNEHHKGPFALTSARNNTLGIVQFFNFYRIITNAKVPMPPPSGKTFIPKVEALRSMFSVAGLEGKVVLSLGLDLAWRLGDFINLKKNDLPDLNQPSPIPISKITSKENAISATFISSETVELLKAYLPTLRGDNEFLFPSPINGSHMKDESILKILHELAEKAKVEVPKNKHLTFHSLRKRFLSTCATLNIDSEYACLMVGKKTETGDSFETYLEDANFIDSFKKVREETKPYERQIQGYGRIERPDYIRAKRTD
jgi:integrase